MRIIAIGNLSLKENRIMKFREWLKKLDDENFWKKDEIKRYWESNEIAISIGKFDDTWSIKVYDGKWENKKFEFTSQDVNYIEWFIESNIVFMVGE